MTGGPVVGLMLDSGPRDGASFAALARECEEAGFAFATVHPDHPSASGMRGTGPSLEAWTAATWALAATRRLVVLPGILGLPYRHPGVVAKQAESLARLSGGRVLLGLGAGGDDLATSRFGLPARPPAEKIEALEEAVQVVRALWASGPEARAAVRGRHFEITDACINPPAAHRIPIWLGVYERRGRGLVARRADGWFPSSFVLPPEQAVPALAEIRDAAEQHGRDPDAITGCYNLTVEVRRLGGESPGSPLTTVVGTPERVVEEVGRLGTAGFGAVNLWPLGDVAAQTEILAADVLPKLPAASAEVPRHLPNRREDPLRHR